MCQYRDLGPPADWPENKDEALLDCGYEVAGLGINSDTETEAEDDVAT